MLICANQARFNTKVFSNKNGINIRSRSRGLYVEANKKVRKTQQVILQRDIPKLGSKGEMLDVVSGYWRNYLQPQGYAKPVTQEILAKMEEERLAEERRVAEIKAKATAMATALQTIGKFMIKKQAGEEGKIFGSVSAAEIIEAIEKQTGRKLEKDKINMPEIKEIGTFDVSVKLHPEVTGFFKVVVQKQKQKN
eukprot:TRINITY_DN2111_c0_g1_i1.p2 TRINITY_DN2111_c0_g1~~TRINITY_DN2111_c0_g1_i1.p2  ORF type:complete len:208 (-),score=36.25 TRINITY_DN2111_c0_g1_i1:221-802(-)